jgi:arabinofuranosyltransferase
LAWLGLLASFTGFAIFAWQASQFWPQTLDDAFITFRYSQNLVAGYGPLWNPGLPAAEGYTTFLWMLVMAIPHALGTDAVVFSKVVGVVATLATGVVTWHLAAALCPAEGPTRRWVPGVAVLFLAAFYPTATHAVSGMETALYTLWLQAFCYGLVLLDQKATPRRLRATTLAALLLVLTRPDGGLVVALGLLIVLVRMDAGARRGLVVSSLLYTALPYAVYFSWRFVYYGHLLPLTFYVKVADETGFAGTATVVAYLTYVGWPLGVLVAIGLFRHAGRMVAPVVAAAALVAFYTIPVHVMGVEFRFCAPTFPLLAVLAGVGLAALVEWAPVRVRPAAVVVIACAASLGLLRNAEGAIGWAQGYAERLESTHIALGRKLATLRGEGDSPVLAINDAGAVPYYSGWTTIDTVGLNDPTIALSGEHDPATVLDRKPDLVVVPSLKPRNLKAPHEWQEALYYAAVERGMEKVRRIGGAYYHLWLIAPPDSRIGVALARWRPAPKGR